MRVGGGGGGGDDGVGMLLKVGRNDVRVLNGYLRAANFTSCLRTPRTGISTEIAGGIY